MTLRGLSASAVRALLSGAVVVASCVGLASFALRALVPGREPWNVRSVPELDRLASLPHEPYVLAGVGIAVVAVLWSRPVLASPRVAAMAPVLVLLAIAGTVSSPHGLYVLLLTCAAFVSILVGTLLAERAPRAEAIERPPRDRAAAGLLWLCVAAVMAVYSMHRHFAFGSGSWDLGCMVHNFYRASRGLDTTSSVLGEVDFLGDHFMIGIYVFAPILWVNSSAYTVLLIQSVSLAATAPAIYLIARRRGAPRFPACALALAVGLSFGLQSAAYFDGHEVTVGFGFLAFALLALDGGRLRLASLLFAAFALFKESLGAYVVAMGLLAVAKGLARDPGRERRRLLAYGLLWIGGGAIWFVLVNRVFMPALIARAGSPEPHETFAEFGPTVFEALLGMMKHPLKAVAALFVPSEKVTSLLVTLSGVGGLALVSPEILLAALPLLAERFLSSKSTMWEMGYHYAAPLCLYAGWAVAAGWARVRRLFEALLGAIGPGLVSRAGLVAGSYLVASALLVNAVGYRHPANFLRWEMDYFSAPARRASNRRAVDFVLALGRDARLAVQNRLLPHVADRPHIYRLGDWSKADLVLLSVGENAWPWDDGFPARLAATLGDSPDWHLVFSEAGTAVFARRSIGALLEVPPAPDGVP